MTWRYNSYGLHAMVRDLCSAFDPAPVPWNVRERRFEWWDAWVCDRAIAGIEISKREAREQWESICSTVARECAIEGDAE